MKKNKEARRGSWPSPIDAEAVALQARALDQPRIDGSDIYWIEGQPDEGGRAAVMRARPDGTIRIVTPFPFNVRSRVHEYGGGAYAVDAGVVYAAHFADGRIYRFVEGEEPVAITEPSRRRFGDLIVDARHSRLIAVCEDHTEPALEPLNSLVAIALHGPGAVTPLVSGNDFYSSPTLSPDAETLAWLTWNHPDMPWNATELWSATIAADGRVSSARRCGSRPEESLFQPRFSPDGQLYVVADRTGWWNLYRVEQDDLFPICAMDAEFGRPQWVLGISTYGFIDDRILVAAYTRDGVAHVVRLDLVTGSPTEIATPYSEVDALRVSADALVLLGGAARLPAELAVIEAGAATPRVLARTIDVVLDREGLSEPRALRFPSTGGRDAHAFYYAPASVSYTLPEGELPPLLVISHGGPTSSSSSTLRLSIQYWTSRGFAVLDVNYGGSSGYGRAYRDALNRGWGIVDVEDCIAGARYAVDLGLADGERLAIRGSSAGGFTTLCALTFHNTFKAGASYYGVSDLKALDRDTHKFESRYTTHLLGAPAERERVYRERSPIHHVDRITCPVIFFQGLEDKVVPPSQSEVIVEALRSRGVALAYIAFAGEGHGFRRPENVQRALESELYFYCRVLGLDWLESAIPVVIENL